MKLEVEVKTLPTFLADQKDFDGEDIDTFLEAATPKDFEDLRLLFSMMDLSFYSDRHALKALRDNPESESLETWIDIQNYQAILRKALEVKALTSLLKITKESIEEAGIGIAKLDGVMSHLSLTIPLEYGWSTYRFLDKGVKAAKQRGYFCYIRKHGARSGHKSFSLTVNSHPWFFDDEAGYHELFSKGCFDILNTLNAIMLQDLMLDWSDNKEIVLSAQSPASSFWSSMLASSQKYRVGRCIVCGKIFNAQDNGNRRKFCKPNSACTKKYQRLVDYIEFKAAGMDKAAAAKAAHVLVEDAENYWTKHPVDAKRVEDEARIKQAQTTNEQT